MPRAGWPDRPPFEGDRLDEHLARVGADPEARTFAHELAQTGVARIDLGDEGRALCDRVAEEMDAVFAGGAGRVQDAWLRSRAVRRLAVLPKVKRLLEVAYGRPPFAFQTLNFRRGTEQETHSDAIHFHSRPERFMCGVWVALEDIAPGAGPLSYRPGSHRLPVLTMQAAGVNHDRPTLDDYRRVYVPALKARLDAARLPTAEAVLQKGQALVWAANLAHGGAPIADPASTRRSLVTHFFFKGCLYYTPMTSDEAGDRLSVRLPVNVETGGVEWPRRSGRYVLPRAPELKAAAAKLLLRRPHVQ